MIPGNSSSVGRTCDNNEISLQRLCYALRQTSEQKNNETFADIIKILNELLTKREIIGWVWHSLVNPKSGAVGDFWDTNVAPCCQPTKEQKSLLYNCQEVNSANNHEFKWEPRAQQRTPAQLTPWCYLWDSEQRIRLNHACISDLQKWGKENKQVLF